MGRGAKGDSAGQCSSQPSVHTVNAYLVAIVMPVFTINTQLSTTLALIDSNVVHLLGIQTLKIFLVKKNILG